jgi:hypothetical protein
LPNVFLTREAEVGKAAPSKEPEPELFLEELEPCQIDLIANNGSYSGQYCKSYII